MAITSVDDIAAGLSVAQHRPYLKNITAPKAAGSFQSGWLATGLPPAGVAPPAYNSGAGYTSDKSTTGALLYTNAVTQNYLAKFSGTISQVGSLLVLDRLWSCSGMGFAAATYTTTTPGALPARVTDNGASAELWVEQYAAAGAASGTLTSAYLDADGSAQSSVIPAVVSAPVIGQLQPCPLVNNRGVKQLTSVTNNATWTSGSWGMLIARRYAEIPVQLAGGGLLIDWAALGLPALPADACLMFAFLANTTTAPVIAGSLDIIDK